MQRNMIETVMGAVVLAGAAFFFYVAYQAADITDSSGYQIKAEFGNVSGLSAGDDVMLSGIKIGQVVEQNLDPITYSALVVMAIKSEIELPDDSSARITASSLLGGNYLEVMPGLSETMLEAGDVIYDTRDPVSLTDLLGKVVFSAGSDGQVFSMSVCVSNGQPASCG